MDLVEPRHPAHVGEPAVQGMTFATMLVSTGHQQRQALILEAGDQVRKNVERCTVRPLKIIDHQNDRRQLREPIERLINPGQQPAWISRLSTPERRHQLGELVRRRSSLQAGHPGVCQPSPQGTDDGRERNRGSSEVHTATPQHLKVVRPPAAGVADQTCLADAGLTFDHQGARFPARRRLQSTREELLLIRSAGEPRVVRYCGAHGASISRVAGPRSRLRESVR
ncbi:hypothetical protein OG876_41460 [Kribbella sp. NBC_00359]